MSLLAALNLAPTAKHRAAAEARARNDEDYDRLKAVVGEKMKTAVQLVSAVDDKKRKVELAQALDVADKQRQAAARMIDGAAKVEAMQKADARLQGTIDQLLPKSNQEAAGAAQARATAALLRPRLAADREAAAHAAKLAWDAVLEADEAAKKATGDAKKAADLKKAAADKQLADVTRRHKQIDADLQALDNDSTSAEAAQQIIARNGGAGTLKSSDLIQLPPGGLTKGSVGTSSDVVNGTAKTTTTTATRTTGIGTWTDKQDTTTTEIKGDRKTTTTDSRSTKLGLDLAPSTEKTTKKEHEKDGKTTSVENKTTTAASVADGTATHGKTTTVTRSDGSSTETSTSGGLERSDGKLGANLARSKTDKDADGNEKKASATGKGGLIAGKDGIGAFGDGEIGHEGKTKGGMKTGVVGGLSANVVCNVVKDESCDPPMYDVTLSVDLGIRVGASKAYDKEPEKGKPDEDTRATAKVSLGASQKVVMVRKHRLDEAGAQRYADALKSGKGSEMEFGIIACGRSKGWDAARDMYLALTKDVTSAAVADRLEKGGSLKVGGEDKGNLGAEVGAKGGAIGASVSVGVEKGHEGSVTVSKDQDGKVTYDAKQGDSIKGTKGVKVNAGVMEGGFSMGREEKTSKGYKIAIPADASKKDADAMRKALAACKSQADLDAFAEKYPKAVQETTKTTGQADTKEVTVGAGKVAKLGMKFGSGIEEEETKDAQGKKSTRTTGTSEGGAELSVLGRKIGDSSKQTATSTTDAQGKSRTDVSEENTSTDTGKLLASLPGSGEGGVLSKATGGTDTDVKSTKGLGLDDATLKRLGSMAVEDWNAWMHAPVNADDRKDWAIAGRAIQKAKGATSTVAKELAKFVGSNDRQRMQVIEDTVRGSRGTGGGDAWEFSGDLARLKPDYDRVVIAPSEETVTEQSQDPAKAKAVADKLLDTLETLNRAVSHETSFKSPARRAEMLSAINNRRSKVRLALKQVGGPVTAPSKEEQMQRYNELLANCRNYQEDEKKLFMQVQERLESVFGGSAADNQKVVAELQKLYKTWDPEYEEMATLAQANKWGDGIYWRYRPDRDKYQLAHDNKKPFGEKESDKKKDAQRFENKLAKDEKNRLPDPNAKSDDQLRAERKQADDDRVKKGTAIQNELPGASRAANDRGMLLFKCVKREEKYAAVDFFNAGKKLWDEGEAFRNQIHKDHMPELVSIGPKALDKYKAAIAQFDKGLALYPKDWRK